ncbi:HIR complex subunit [Thecaphora frezii]
MSLVLPAWVAHYGDDKKKRSTIFSVSVHPDGSRLATAGLDTKIRIWATQSILSPDVEAQPDAHKLLSTLARHTGSVLVVRWSNSGRFLASGSDDTVALIWDLDHSGMGNAGSFGSTELNVESWRPHRRLAAHESDVVDIAWSDDDEFIATVGLDSLAYVWSGVTFDKLRKIDGHHGFVKGVVFDPLGQYLATASDDKTVKVWRTDDWTLAADISDPFATSPSSTFFRRPSWSPDGDLLLCANAMSGPVFVSSVVKRVDWSSDVHFVGHENSIVVTAFSPKIFVGFDGGSHSCVVALGSLDQSVSIWVTGLEKPVLVARDVFERQVMDLSWSSDGYTLYASSSDGTVAVFKLTPEILSEALGEDRLQISRAKHGFKRVRTQASSRASAQAVGTLERPNVLQVRKAGAVRANGSASPAVRPAPGRTERLRQEITITRDGKRRIKPTPLGGDGYPADSADANVFASPAANGAPGASASAVGPRTGGVALQDTSMDVSLDMGVGPSSRMMMPRGSPALAVEDMMMKMMNIFMQTQQQLQQQQVQQMQQLIQALPQLQGQGQPQAPQTPPQPPASAEADGDAEAPEARGEKRKASFGEEDIEPLNKIPKGRTKGEIGKTLGGETQRESMGRPVAVRRRIEGSTGIVEDGVRKGVRLAVPELLSVYRREEEHGTIEIRNFDRGRPSEIASLDNGDGDSIVWLDFSPSPGLLGTMTPHFSAVALEDHSILIYSSKGRRLGNLFLDSPCFRLESNGNVLMAITISGLMHRWDVRADREMHRPVSVLPLLGDPDNLVSASIHANGAPIVLLRTEKVYTFDDRKLGWVCVGDGWFADHSSAWDGKTRGRGTEAAMIRDPVKAIEAEINNLVVARSQRESPSDDGADSQPGCGNNGGDDERERRGKMKVPSERQADFELAVTLRHLETRLVAARIFESANEYKNYLLAYARRLGEEGIRNQSEDLIKSLIGPIYHKPGLEKEWQPTILGHDKRQLLGSVLQILAKPRILTSLVQPYQDILAQMKG